MDSIDYLDNYDADRQEPPEAFYTEALLCESCGAPTFLDRVWNAEHELWIAQDCSCNTPDVPLAPCMIRVLEAAQTVGQLCDSVKAHRKSCPVCSGVVELPKAKKLDEREAA